MCGNDFLQARSAFAEQTGTCSFSGVDDALAACTTYQELAMQAINQYATTAKKKMIMNIYYPGYAAMITSRPAPTQRQGKRSTSRTR